MDWEQNKLQTFFLYQILVLKIILDRFCGNEMIYTASVQVACKTIASGEWDIYPGYQIHKKVQLILS